MVRTFISISVHMNLEATMLIFDRLNDGDAPTPDGKSIGDKINNLTGGRMSWLTDGIARKQEDVRAGVDKTPKMHEDSEDGNGTANGKASGRAPRKIAEKPKDNTNHQSDGVQKRTTKSAGGSENTASKVGEKTDDTKETAD